MTKGDLVLVKIQGMNVIGYIQYIINDHISVHVDHSFKVNRGNYIIQKSLVKLLDYDQDSKQWRLSC
jgi:hypothetical protein